MSRWAQRPYSAVLMASLASAIAPSIVVTLAYISLSTTVASLVRVMAWTATVSAAHTILLGVPLFFLARYFDRASWVNASLGGALVGILPSAIWGIHIRLPEVTQNYSAVDSAPAPLPLFWAVSGLRGFAILGLIGAWTFWLVWHSLVGAYSSATSRLTTGFRASD